MNKQQQLALVAGVGGAAALTYQVLARWRRRIDFEGKAVLITGGSRGLGLDLARALAEEGARIALVARDAVELERARLDLEDTQVALIQRDLSQLEECTGAVQDAVHAFGGLDILINNAGTMDVGPIEYMSGADFERSLAIHLWAPIATMSAGLPWLARSGGRIVNIASVGGMVAVPHLAAYCTGKFALVGVSDALRAELRRHGVYMTTVCPGLMRTGSHVNAHFRGSHQSEYAWFATSAAVGSVSAERAARRILRACRYGTPHLTISLPARLLVLANAILPNVTAEAMALVARLLPEAPPKEDTTLRRQTGWESRGAERSGLTWRADRVIEEHNQLAGHGPEELLEERR